MATYKELNSYFQELFNRDLPRATLTRWVQKEKIQAQKINNIYDYDFDSFKTYIHSDQYQTKAESVRQKPQDYIGKISGQLKITGIVPKNEYKEQYGGTLMYCDCLRCGKKHIQVRFSYLTPNGNYHQDTCGCGRKERAFLASAREDMRKDFLAQFNQNFEWFLFLHKILTSVTDGYYVSCPLEEYEEAIKTLNLDTQLLKVYNFWQKHQKETGTFYDWAKPSLDHKIPKSKGGSNKISNLHVITVFENLAKRDMTWEEWEEFKKKSNTRSDYFIESILGISDGRENIE